MTRYNKKEVTPLAKLVREVLAQNPHNDDESLMRCTCDDCVIELANTMWRKRPPSPPALLDVYRQLSALAYGLPIHPNNLDDLNLIAFRSELHKLHVLAYESTQPPPEGDTP